jgi:hypothetical protein
MALYRDSYEPIEEEEGSFIKVRDSPRPCDLPRKPLTPPQLSCPSHILQPSFLDAVFVAVKCHSTALSCFVLSSITL